jgi:surfactin synthase thioesterase subunit
MDMSRWFGPVRSDRHVRLRLFCLPYAGGGSSIFRDWSAGVPTEIDVCPVRLPGREARWNEPSFVNIHELVASLAEELRRHLDVPYVLFGHSMGALVAYELARHLRWGGHAEPVQFVVAGARAPHRPDPFPPIHHLPDDALAQKLKQMQGTPPEVLENPELLRLVLPMIRADFTMCETYVHAPDLPLSCPITAYGGEADRQVTIADLAAWRCHTIDAFSIHTLPGAHFFLNTSRGLLLRAVSRDLQSIISCGRPMLS